MKNNRYSLLNMLQMNLLITNIIIIIFVIISPFIFYSIFVNSQFSLLLKEINNASTADEVIFYAIENGYDVEASDNLLSLLAAGQVCNINDVMVFEEAERIFHQTKMVSLEFDQPCGKAVISLNYHLLTSFIEFFGAITMTTFTVIIVVNILKFMQIKKKMNAAFASVNKEIKRIEELRIEKNYFEEDTFEEFQVVLRNIHRVNGELNNYLDEKHTLVSSLNHELKSPVNKINSLIQAYELGIPGYDDEKKMTSIIKEELDVMISILNYSLEIFLNAKIKKVMPINVRELINELIKHKQEELSLRNLKGFVYANEDIIWNADINIVRLVLSNLIENITKYAKDDTTFYIKITDERIIFINQVEDIKESGTQQGLKLSKELLKSNGSELRFKSKEERFIVEIKYRKEN